ncbi:carbohydrate binding domain-containing protein [Marinimicrobium alkaliphilum]|uniref:carbohydrate binding domain-containing protein n=1 Tax=Marinimicrobium alkaliphilum TaxID=2202654 RepID=UPI00130084E9|nr:carbohydrate binding domain-containing protein [Marinimicrobium alkaliphilum]
MSLRRYFAPLPTLLILWLAGCSSSSDAPLTTPLPEEQPPSTEAPPAALVPFVLPWDDASPGITNLSNLNHTPAGRYGYVGTNDDGRFVLEGDPIRFWGVNITAESSFPDADDAEKIAARLAKFGINIVRFHHMDFGWSGMNTASLIDYPQGNSRNLNADNLDRLDYFIAQLRAQGIYVNLNLLNSRFFYPEDGLPDEVTQLDWKESHVLGFINDDFRNLEKAFAQQLLTHTNPYTGLSYAADPAIVMVEVNNENSLFQQFYDGAIDQWPAVFREQLADHWNTWLQARHASTEALEAAWGAADEDSGEELLSAELGDWVVEFHEGAEGLVEAGSHHGREAWHWQVTAPGSDTWHAQLNQPGLTFDEDQLYTLSFYARADNSTSLSANLQRAYGDYSTFDSRHANLGSEWQRVEWTFFAPVSDDNLRINFNGFGNRLANVYLADISLTRGGTVEALAEGENLEQAGINPNRRAGSYTRERMRDWAAFIRDLEYAYWQDMRDFIKVDLAYPGLVAGTTIMNSPPSAQAVYDFADGHSYWQHPVFPGEPWDSNNWTVGNDAMVNTWNGTLGNLARERIHGMPFTVSEYQHASPNTYSSEGPLLIAAYAALQDWDGIMMFAYDAGAGGNWGAEVVDNFFSMTAHPTKMANMLAGALIYRRGDVSPAQESVLINFDTDTELEILTTRGSSWNVANASHLGVPSDLALRHRIAMDLSAELGLDTAPAALDAAVAEADTGELRWDRSRSGKGVVTLDTEASKGVIGFIDGQEFILGNVTIAIGETQQDWATLTLTTRSGSFATPDQPAQVLLVATGLMENTGQQWNANQNSLGSDWGRAPTLIEVVNAEVTLPFRAEDVSVWALDEQGQKGTPIPVENHNGNARLTIGGETQTLWYEIEHTP